MFLDKTGLSSLEEKLKLFANKRNVLLSTIPNRVDVALGEEKAKYDAETKKLIADLKKKRCRDWSWKESAIKIRCTKEENKVFLKLEASFILEKE